MLDQALRLFDIRPDCDLDVMQIDQGLPEITGRILFGLRKIIEGVHPDVMLVQGDTTTTFAAALSGFYANIPVGHVEAGLRTGNVRQPFPEEINRVLTTRLASWHFAPTGGNRENLLREGVPSDRIMVSGNTIIDALLWVQEQASREHGNWPDEIWGSAAPFIKGESPIVLITGHRRENFGVGFRNICEALVSLAQRNRAWQFVYPVHLNPNVRTTVYERLAGIPNIHLIPPLDYCQFVFLMGRSYLILTDSGGVQEEGPALGKPVLVMREVTERPEAIDSGAAVLVGTDRDQIVHHVEELINDHARYDQMARGSSLFGDGRASARIVEYLQGVIL